MKLFASDMDGTLLAEDFSISRENLQAIDRLVTAGVVFAIATGRSYTDVVSIMDRYGLHCPVVAGNGSCVYGSDGKLVAKNLLELDMLSTVCHYMDSKQIFYGINSTDNLTVTHAWEQVLRTDLDDSNGDDYATVRELFLSQAGLAYADSMAAFLGGTRDSCSISVMCLSRDKLAELCAFVRTIPSLLVTMSGRFGLEIMPAGCSKAAGLTALAAHLGIAQCDIAVVGDNYNDADMLRWSAVSFAMGNAPDDIKQISKYVTLPCNQHGVAAAIDSLLKEGFAE